MLKSRYILEKYYCPLLLMVVILISMFRSPLFLLGNPTAYIIPTIVASFCSKEANFFLYVNSLLSPPLHISKNIWASSLWLHLIVFNILNSSPFLGPSSSSFSYHSTSPPYHYHIFGSKELCLV